jgi:hypothetical protein
MFSSGLFSVTHGIRKKNGSNLQANHSKVMFLGKQLISDLMIAPSFLYCNFFKFLILGCDKAVVKGTF